MQVGFAVMARGGEVEVQLFGAAEAVRSRMVAYAEGPFAQAVLMGRLYYRDELLQRLGDAGAADASDARLALAAYCQWGAEGIRRLEGDFAVAVFDRQRRRLIASRDVVGGYPIYWLQRGDAAGIATGLRPLTGLLPGCAIDLAYLGELQMVRFGETDFLERTPFEGIHRLVPGYCLEVDLDHNTARSIPFWDWSRSIVDPGSDRIEELAERYAALLRHAVRERLRGTVAAHFSGGMDSTSVALLAREELHRQERPLHALSLIYEKLANLKGETAYINAGLDRPGIVPHRLIADDLLDYDAFRDAPLHDEPFSGLFRIGLLGALTRLAADVGAQTILSGLGADEVLADAPYHIADLLQGGRLWKAWSEALAWSRARNCSIWRYLGAYGVAPLLPAVVQVGPRTVWRGGFAQSGEPGRWSIPPWVRPEFARRANLAALVLERVRREFGTARSVALSEALARIRYFATGDWCRYALSAPLGIVDTHPFRDRRVLSFGLSARSRITPVPDAQKRLLNEAMRDILPDAIRRRRSKEHFNAVYYDGLSRNLPYLEALVRDTRMDELELFDQQQLLDSLRKTALGVGNMDGTAGLNSSLAIIKWLAQLPAWHSQACLPARTFRGSAGQQSANSHRHQTDAAGNPTP